MLDLSNSKKILISSYFLALLCADNIVTIVQINLTAFESFAFAGCGFSLGVFLCTTSCNVSLLNN